MALDFEIIKTDSITKLTIVDQSDWTGLTGSEADILKPESDTPEVVTIDKNLVNTFTMSDLAVTAERLPDGIYEITLRDTAGTTTKTIKHLRTANLRLIRDKLFLHNLDDENLNNLLTKDLAIIDLNIDAAYSYLKEEDMNRTNYFYNRAKERIEILLNCKL